MAKNGKWKAAALRAARAAAREADRLMKIAKQRVESSGAKQRLKRALKKAGRVLKAAGTAAVKAGIAAGKEAAKR
jgi:hypothetical protein